MKSFVTEFVGTFFLVLTIGLTVIGNVPLAPLAIGLSLMCMVYMGGHVSGGHFNPAVTLAVFLRRKCTALDLPIYWIAQLAGAVAAAYMVQLLTGQNLTVAPREGLEASHAIIVELLFTFALALVVLQTATHPKVANNSFYGLAIGMTVAFAAFAGGPISGGAFNPAVGVGPNLVRYLNGAADGLNPIWIYVVGPLAGGVLAALVYRLQDPGREATG
ncbi:MAG: aquaporin [Phycisphaerae bacterium]